MCSSLREQGDGHQRTLRTQTTVQLMRVNDILIGSIAGNEALTSAPLAGAVLVGLLVSWVVLKLVPKADAVSVILYCRTLPP